MRQFVEQRYVYLCFGEAVSNAECHLSVCLAVSRVRTKGHLCTKHRLALQTCACVCV